MGGGFETAMIDFCNRRGEQFASGAAADWRIGHTPPHPCDRFQKIRNGNGSAQWAVGEAIFYPPHDKKKYTPYQRISTYIIKATLLFYKSHLKVVL